MFRKLVAIEEIGLDQEHLEKVKQTAREYVAYPDTTLETQEIVRRIGDADGALVSFTGKITGDVIDACPNLKYIGMCCTLYDEKSANVDLAKARQRGIAVTGIRDYGDEGVIEYGISELIRLMHGFGDQMWKSRPSELTGVKAGILGMGRTGGMMADALRFFGAEVYYYSRTRKPEQEARGSRYLPLEELLQTVEIVSAHLNKNTILLHEKEFEQFGNGKILLNTAIGPCFDLPALQNWLKNGKGNFYLCDGVAMDSMGDALEGYQNAIHTLRCSGSSVQCTARLSQKVLENIEAFLQSQK